MVSIDKQSADIAMGVDKALEAKRATLQTTSTPEPEIRE